MLLSFTNAFHSRVRSIFPSTFNDLTEAQRPGPGRDSGLGAPDRPGVNAWPVMLIHEAWPYVFKEQAPEQRQSNHFPPRKTEKRLAAESDDRRFRARFVTDK